MPEPRSAQPRCSGAAFVVDKAATGAQAGVHVTVVGTEEIAMNPTPWRVVVYDPGLSMGYPCRDSIVDADGRDVLRIMRGNNREREALADRIVNAVNAHAS